MSIKKHIHILAIPTTKTTYRTYVYVYLCLCICTSVLDMLMYANKLTELN